MECGCKKSHLVPLVLQTWSNGANIFEIFPRGLKFVTYSANKLPKLIAGMIHHLQWYRIQAPGLSYWESGGYWASLMGGRAGSLVHYIWYKLDILDIFSKYSFKISWIYLNISLSGRHEGLSGIMGEQAVQARRRASKQP